MAPGPISDIPHWLLGAIFESLRVLFLGDHHVAELNHAADLRADHHVAATDHWTLQIQEQLRVPSQSVYWLPDNITDFY